MSVRVQINAICFEADSEKDNSKPKKKGKKMSKTVKLVRGFYERQRSRADQLQGRVLNASL